MLRNLIWPLGLLLAWMPLWAYSDADPQAAVARISSALYPGCGTGFFIDAGHTLVTNAHVAELFCRGPTCESMRLERQNADGTMQLLSGAPVTLAVSRVLPAIDVAFLTMPDNATSPAALQLSTAEPKSGETLRMIGFPSCGKFQSSAGAVGSQNSISFSSGATGASGSSGSPILGADGTVAGIAFQSDSVMRALYDKFWGGHFTLRAIRADVAQTARAAEQNGSRAAEINLLLQFYTAHVAHADGIQRVAGAIFFIDAVRGVTDALARETSDPDLLRSAVQLDHFPGVIVQVQTPPAAPEALAYEQLVFASNLESRGAFISFVQPLQKADFENALRAQHRPQSDIDALTALLPTAGAKTMPGLASLGVALYVTAALLLLLLLILYGFSLGYVYGTAKGGKIRRAVTAIGVAILVWPISFFVFLFLGKRRF